MRITYNKEEKHFRQIELVVTIDTLAELKELKESIGIARGTTTTRLLYKKLEELVEMEA